MKPGLEIGDSGFGKATRRFRENIPYIVIPVKAGTQGLCFYSLPSFGHPRSEALWGLVLSL
jgi:hypothetical protein